MAWRQQQTGGRLALVLIAGTLQGVIAGSVIRVELLPGPRAFDLVVAAVLLPLGIWLALSRPPRPGKPARPARLIPATVLVVLAAVVGCVGGIYGIGGGSIVPSHRIWSSLTESGPIRWFVLLNLVRLDRPIVWLAAPYMSSMLGAALVRSTCPCVPRSKP
jgi:uncharacterized membrane protein YfcA